MCDVMSTQGYLVLAELNLVKSHHPPGVFIIPDRRDPLVWLGIISVRSGYYHGGIFHFQLRLPTDFPSKILPKLYLPKGFFHPYVDIRTGELSLSSAFSSWKPGINHIWHVLHHLRCLLTSPTSCVLEHSAQQIHFLSRSSIYEDTKPNHNCSSYANPEAADLIVNHKSVFEENAKACVKQLSLWSKSDQGSADVNGGNFAAEISGWEDNSVIERARQELEAAVNPPPPDAYNCQGYSWIDAKTMSIFSAEPGNEESDS